MKREDGINKFWKVSSGVRLQSKCTRVKGLGSDILHGQKTYRGLGFRVYIVNLPGHWHFRIFTTGNNKVLIRGLTVFLYLYLYIFSKVLYIMTLYNKYTWALTFENFCRSTSCHLPQISWRSVLLLLIMINSSALDKSTQYLVTFIW